MTAIHPGDPGTPGSCVPIALLAVSFLVGSEIPSFFGITLVVIQITGGLIVASTGWCVLNQPEAA
jgi:multiple antibiotic resistance protein